MKCGLILKVSNTADLYKEYIKIKTDGPLTTYRFHSGAVLSLCAFWECRSVRADIGLG